MVKALLETSAVRVFFLLLFEYDYFDDYFGG